VATIKNEMEIGYKENGKRMGRKGKKKKKQHSQRLRLCLMHMHETFILIKVLPIW